MKIVVLAGGLSTERDVSLTSGAGICRTLRENRHQAFLLDVFLGFPYDSDKLEEVFTLPNAGLEIADGIKTTEPDLAAIKASREDQSDCFLGPNVIDICRLADIVFMGLHGDVGENGKGARTAVARMRMTTTDDAYDRTDCHMVRHVQP